MTASGRETTRTRSAAPGLWTLLVALLAVSGPASAHAVLHASVPAHGAHLEAPPSSVSVTLTEPIDPAGSGLAVLDAQGNAVHNGTVLVSGGSTPTLQVALRPGLPDGAYRVRWHALSTADGHTTSGQVGFAVGDFVPPGASQLGTGVPVVGAVARALAYTGLALALGAIAFHVHVRAAPAMHRPLLLAGASLHAAGVLLLVVSGRSETGLMLATFLGTEVGHVLLLRLASALGAVLLAAIAWRRPQLRLPLLAAGVLLLAAAMAAARHGHASLHGVPGTVVDWLHLVAGAAWAGGLVAFLVALPHLAPGELPRVAVRFGTFALACVLVLGLAGAGASLVILGPQAWAGRDALLASTWGRVLAAKVLVLAAMVALAARNRRHAKAASAGFGRGLQAEAALGALALVLAGVLTAASPPAEAVGPAALELAGTGSHFTIEAHLAPVPSVGGSSDLMLHIEDPAGDPVAASTCGRANCVIVRVVEQAGNASTTYEAFLGGGGWHVHGLLWTSPGPHRLEVDVQTAEVYLDRIAIPFNVE